MRVSGERAEMSDERIVEMLRQRIERAERGLRFAWYAVGALGVVCVVLAVMRPGGSGEQSSESTPEGSPALVEVGEGQFEIDGIVWARGFVLSDREGNRGAAISYGEGGISETGPGLRLYDPREPELLRAAMWVENSPGRVRTETYAPSGK